MLDEIENHRYPEKNALIIQISFKLGLRAQEMALPRIREVATLGAQFPCGYDIKIGRDSRAGKSLEASEYYPEQKKPGGLTRELPIADSSLIDAITRYLAIRMADQKP